MSDKPRSGEFELPPELSDLENSLRELPLPNESALDRDELMFQSGWAAALAAQNKSPIASASVTRWGWPVLTGTFATLSAVLVIALFAVPSDNGSSPVTTVPAAEAPLLVVESQATKSQPTKSYNRDSDPLDNPTDEVSGQDPLNLAFGPLVKSIFQFEPAPSSALAMRKRFLRTGELNQRLRRVVYRTSTRPQAAPLKANSYRNQKLWEQL